MAVFITEMVILHKNASLINYLFIYFIIIYYYFLHNYCFSFLPSLQCAHWVASNILFLVERLKLKPFLVSAVSTDVTKNHENL